MGTSATRKPAARHAESEAALPDLEPIAVILRLPRVIEGG